ncbi:MAG: ROK family protein [Candidatus Kapabacteria bacterium]|nr:ROK family protein [Candidatus Kapabacteria bacterium]
MTGAIDIGGTNIKYGVVGSNGNVLWELSTPTVASEGRELVLGRICGVVKQIIEKTPDVVSIGIGVPGVVDPSTKHVQAPPNLPGWDDVDLLAELRMVSPLPMDVENDANAAALGEATMGAGVGHPDFLYVTLGTGIGGGVILDGKLYRGPNGDAGEIGHIILDAWAREGAFDPRPFRTGVMEEYVGIQGILRMAREQGEEVENVRRIQNDAVFKEAGRLIGIGLCSAMAVLGLRVLILGGGVSQAPFIVESIRTTMKHRAIPTIAHALIVLPAQFGSHAGLMGAAAVGRAVVEA